MAQHAVPTDPVICIGTLLNGLSATPSDCCIFRIHKPLRQVNEQAYDPEIVAIGPYHRDNENLKMMEEHKLRYFQSLLRQNGENDARKFVKAIRPLEQKESRFYAKPVSLAADEIIQMMVLDGCFIIELLRKSDMEGLRDQDDPIFKLNWMVNSLKRDLMLFENQLPFSILCKLFDVIEAPNNHNRLIYLALRFFNNLLPGTYKMQAPNSHGNISHLLGLVHNEWLPSVSTQIGNASSVSTPIGNASTVSTSVSTPIGNASSVSTPIGNASSVSATIGTASSVSAPIGNASSVSSTIGTASSVKTSVSTPIGNASSVSTPIGNASTVSTAVSTPIGNASSVSTPIGNTSSASTTIGNASSVSTPIGNASSASATIGTASSVSMPIGNASSVSATIGTASSVSAPIGNASSVSMTIGTASSVSTPIGNASSVSTTIGKDSSVGISVSTPIGNASSVSTTIGNASSMSTSVSTPIGNTSSVSTPIGNASSASVPIGTASSVSMPIGNASSVSATIGTASSVSAPIGNASSVSMTIGTASSVSTSVSTPSGNASSVSTTTGNASSVSTKPIRNASNKKGKGNWRFIPNTTELQEAGVKLKKFEVTGGSLFDIKFNKGKLYIPPLTVEDRTESIFRNLIAYEQYCPDNQRSYVTDYVKFLDCLIDSPKDVEILSGLGIIDNWLGDDEAVSNIFNKISDAVSGTSMHFRYADIFNRVNIYCRRPYNRWMANLNRKYCNGPWAVISVLAGSVLLLLTLAQTLYAVFPFRKI